MYHDERRQGWCEDDGALIVHDCDLRLKRQSICGFLRERKEKQMAKTTDTGLHTLMNFMRENKGLFFYCEKNNCFALVIDHGLTNGELGPKGSCYSSFAVPDADADIETLFIKPVIAAMNRCRDET